MFAPERLRSHATAALRLGRLGCLGLAVLLAGCASGTAKTAPRGNAPAAIARATARPAPAPAPAAAAAPAPRRGAAPASETDGPGLQPIPDLARLADAEPVIEPIRAGGANRPYEVNGRSYVPQTEDRAHRETGLASWYGGKFHGRRTASGEIYDMHAMTAAHPTLPLPSYVRVRNPSNGREVVVRVNDRGPFHRGRIIDLSFAAARKIGVAHGVANVEVERLTFEEIRTGAWRRAPAPDAASVQLAQLGTTPAPVAAARRASEVSPKEVGLAPQELPVLLASAATRSSTPSQTHDSASPPRGMPKRNNMAAGADPDATGRAGAEAAVTSPVSDASRAGGAAVVTLPVVLAEAPPMLALSTSALPAPRPAVAEPVPTLVVLADPSASGPGSGAGPPQTKAADTRPGFWVQLGVFRLRDGAENFHRRVVADVSWLAPVLAVLGETELYRLQAGPYGSRDEAHSVAQRVREALSLVPMVVERR